MPDRTYKVHVCPECLGQLADRHTVCLHYADGDREVVPPGLSIAHPYKVGQRPTRTVGAVQLRLAAGGGPADLTRQQDGACEALASMHASVSCVNVPASVALAQGHSSQPDDEGELQPGDRIEAQYVVDPGGSVWRLSPVRIPLGDGPAGRPQQVLHVPAEGSGP